VSGQTPDFGRGVEFPWENVSTMTPNDYPRITIRLQPSMIRRISLLARSRHMSNAAIIREALTQYFRGSSQLDESLRSYSKN